MSNSKTYYLIVDEEVFTSSQDFEETIAYIYDFGLHTYFYGEKITCRKAFDAWFDWHSGIWDSGDELVDSGGKKHHVYVIEEFYVNQYPDILELVNNYRSKIDLPPLKRASED